MLLVIFPWKMKKKMKVGGEVGLNSRPDMTAFSPPNAPSHK